MEDKIEMLDRLVEDVKRLRDELNAVQCIRNVLEVINKKGGETLDLIERRMLRRILSAGLTSVEDQVKTLLEGKLNTLNLPPKDEPVSAFEEFARAVVGGPK